MAEQTSRSRLAPPTTGSASRRLHAGLHAAASDCRPDRDSGGRTRTAAAWPASG